MANFNVSTTVTNLQETDIVVPTTDQYTVGVTNQLRNIDPVPSAYSSNAGAGGGTNTGTQTQSAVVTVVKVNSTTKYTSNAGDRGVGPITVQCTAGDTIKVITSSSASIDNQPQAVQTTITVSEGVEG
jgi:hypothetical protein